MARLAILSGLCASHIHRIDRLLEAKYSEWKFDYVQGSSKKEKQFQFDVDYLETKLKGYGNQGPHVLAFTPRSVEYKSKLKERIRPFFRLRLLDGAWVNRHLYGGNDYTGFVELFDEILRVEAQWAEEVQPSGVESPILLPEASFRAERHVSEIWRQAQRSNVDFIEHDKLKSYFKRIYLNKIWIDKHDHQFNFRGECHAVPEYPLFWKYSYRIKDGFHYDVTHKNGREFSLCDFNGEVHHTVVNGHLNVCPHGRIHRKASD